MIVAVLQEIDTKVSQEESDVQGRAPLIFALLGLTMPFGDTSHCFPSVVSIIFELKQERRERK